jgi:hypothetical protein
MLRRVAIKCYTLVERQNEQPDYYSTAMFSALRPSGRLLGRSDSHITDNNPARDT